MTELNKEKGIITGDENLIVKNLLRLQDRLVREVMTPRTVVFSLPNTMTVEMFFHKHNQTAFSRILIHEEEQDNIIGFV
ncbi:hemolysin, partial [Bacillus halotolerans]